MDIDILSLFPEFFETPFACSMIKRAREKGLLNIRCVNIRDFAEDKHQTVDDRPYGGGPGMVMKPDPVVKAIRSVKREGSRVVYLSPQGRVFKAGIAEELAKGYDHLVLLCGHYEGIDQRIIDLEVDEEISIGDYVLTSGAPAAVVLVDAVSRFIPGVIGHPEGPYKDSFHGDEEFEGPQYTRPYEFEGNRVPEVLVNGHHKEIEKWRNSRGKEKMRERYASVSKEN